MSTQKHVIESIGNKHVNQFNRNEYDFESKDNKQVIELIGNQHVNNFNRNEHVIESNENKHVNQDDRLLMVRLSL